MFSSLSKAGRTFGAAGRTSGPGRLTARRSSRSARGISRLLASALALVVAGALTAGIPDAVAPAQADHAGNAPGPVNADSTFGWGFEAIDYKFIGGLASYWKVRGPGVVRNQHGMLTLNTAKRGTVSATLNRKGHKVGRWEIRLRSRRYSTAHTNYKVVTELIPAGNRDQRCGARNILLESYKLGGKKARFSIRNLPDVKFTGAKPIAIRNDRWHTFAVEVTRKRISWFVDAHVIRTEKRADALSGVPLTVRFTMQAKKGKRMNPSRMQMDWLRYWTLRKPNQKSTAAPRLVKGTYDKAC